MKKIVSFIVFIVGIIVAAIAMDRLLGGLIEKRVLPTVDSKYMYAYHGGGGEEVVILGASRAAHHYIPPIIEDSLDVKCFNYGCDGQNIYNQYAILNLLLNHAKIKPKLVVLELASIDIINSPNHNTEKLSALHPYYSLDDSLKTVVKLQGVSTSKALNCLKLYQFNSSIHLFLKKALRYNGYTDENKGFVPLYSKWKNDMKIEPVDTSYEIDCLKIRYLKRFIDKCNEESIKVVLINSPHYIRFDGVPKWKIALSEFALDNNLKFFDYEQEERYLTNRNLYNEPYHLNIDGAMMYTKEIVPIIRSQLYY